MKSVFSSSWKSSKQPRKQRKYWFNLPMHFAGKFLAIHLSKELREKHGTRAIRARVGDKVRVLRGTHKGKEGKIERVDLRDRKVYVTGVETIKKEGGKSLYPLTPSNLLLLDLKADKKRFKK